MTSCATVLIGQGGGFAFDEMFGENAQDFCIDFAGQQVSPGATYQPGADPCMECVCGGGGGGDEEDDMNMSVYIYVFFLVSRISLSFLSLICLKVDM